MKLEDVLSAGGYATLAAQNELLPCDEQDPAFLQLLKNFDAQQESDDAHRTRMKKEEDAAVLARQQAQKMGALHARIAQLRSKVAANPKDTAIAAELAAAQTQLFWLTSTV